MKKVIFLLAIALGLIQTTQAQVDCDIMNLIVNVSDTALVKLYHPGPYLTWPPAENIIVWEITDTQGNIIVEDTLIQEAPRSHAEILGRGLSERIPGATTCLTLLV